MGLGVSRTFLSEKAIPELWIAYLKEQTPKRTTTHACQHARLKRVPHHYPMRRWVHSPCHHIVHTTELIAWIAQRTPPSGHVVEEVFDTDLRPTVPGTRHWLFGRPWLQRDEFGVRVPISSTPTQTIAS